MGQRDAPDAASGGVPWLYVVFFCCFFFYNHFAIVQGYINSKLLI